MQEEQFAYDARPRELREILPTWNVGAVREIAATEHGHSNRTFIVEADRGSFVLKAYRHVERARAAWEHVVIKHVAGYGVPAVGGMTSRGGEAIVEIGGRFYALFPFCFGRQIARTDLADRHLAEMGRMLGRIHRALATFAGEIAWRKPLAPNSFQASERLRQLQSLVRARTDQTPFDEGVIARMDGKQRWIDAQCAAEPMKLPAKMQVIHCDFQEMNVFFDSDGGICGVIDWDEATPAPRGWDLARTMNLMLHLDPARCGVLLSGYRQENPIDASELDEGALLYGNYQDHSVWIYEAIYEQGREAARAFADLGEFVPFARQWAQLRRLLS